MSVRNLRGQFVSQRDARVIAAQVTSLPLAEPRTPDFLERGNHWHSGCICWNDMDTPTLSVLSRLAEWWQQQRGFRL